MFQQTFKNIDDILHKDAGCGSELDYVEQTSWVLFLKYLDDLEKDKATAAELTGKAYTPIIAPEFQWSTWASPKDNEGKLDHHKALTGDDLEDFVNIQLFPYFKKYKQSAESADTIEYKIGEIFSELKNRIQSGYNLREIINRIDELRFRTHAEKHEMSHLYEDKIKNMGNAGRNGGEYYTPRPLIKTIIKVVAPEIGQTIYDGAVGSAGFLCEAFDYLMNSRKLTTSDITTLQKKTFYGKEKKSLAYIIGTMNMILHGVEAPNIVHTNTLAENLADIQEKDRYDIILANPPFGGKERVEVQQNFPIKTGETASLFMQHFIKILKAGGKAGVVIKNTFLSNTDNASVALRKQLLENCNLHTVLDLPGGTFTGAGVKTVVLFFEKGSATRKVWFYQLNLDRNLGKTNALNEKDLADFVELQKTKGDSENSWSIDIKSLDTTTYDLSAKNPNKKEEAALRKPKAILEEMKALDEESADILNSILELQSVFDNKGEGWEEKTLGEIADVEYGYTDKSSEDGDFRYVRITDIDKNGELILEDKKYIKYSKEAEGFLIKENDLLMARTGATFAKVLLYKDYEPSVFASYLIRIKFKEKIENELYWHFTKTNFYWEQANRLSSGAAQPHFNGAAVKQVIFPYPKSVKEQKILIEKFQALSTETKKLEAIYQRKINDLEELKKSVLQKAFSGELKEKT